MPDVDYRVQPITFERGVNESVEASLLPAGAAVRLRNWAADPSGNLRVRPHWRKAVTTGAPATRTGKGAAAYTRTNKPVVVQSNTGVNTASTTTINVPVSWPRGSQTARNLLVMRVLAGHTTSTTPISGVTISGGSWVSAITKNSDATAPGQFAGIYYIQDNPGNVPSVSVTVTGAASTPKFLFVEISEWANMAYSMDFDSTPDPTLTSSNSGNSASVTWANPLQPAGAENPQPRLDIAAAIVSAVGNFTPGTSPNDYTETADRTAGGVATAGCFSRVASDKTLAFNQTVSTAGYWISIAAAFKAATNVDEMPYIVAASTQTSPAAYKMYYINRSQLASGGTWTLADTFETGNTAYLDPPVAWANGLGSLFYANQYFDAIHRWDNISTASAITGAPAGRTLAFHKNRLWSGGSTFAPTRLFYSEINDYNDWTGLSGTNYIDIATDDGEPIEDVVSFGSYLLIGKRNSLWLLSGSSEDDFSLSKLSGGGCAPGRSMVATPYGAIVAGRTGVWLVTGEGSVESLSRAIVKNYASTGYMSASFASDVASICDSATGYIWSINMNTGVWAEERVDSTTECPAYITQSNELQLFSPKSATIGSLVSYRTLPANTRTKDFDTLTETFEAITPELWPVGNTVKITPRHLFVRVRQRGGTSEHAGLTITPYYEGWEGTAQTFGPQDEAGVYRYRFDLGERRGVNYAQFKFSQTVPSGQASVVDIEEVEFGFNVEQVR